MTFLLLLSPTAPSCVKGLVVEHGEVLYENIGRHNEDSLRRVFQEASRVPGETLILDLDLSPGGALIRAVHAFRISRPDTRIVMLVGARQPGDQTISALVSLGVYNICATDNEEVFAKEFEACLRCRDGGTYASAARWHRGFRDESPQKERVVIERRPVGRVTIAVAGMAPGMGCTHTALMLTAFLAKCGHAVALVEDSQRRVLGSIAGPVIEQHRRWGGFRLYGADIFPAPVRHDGDYEGLMYDQMLSTLSVYEYVVRDMGVLDVSRLRELYRAECAVAVTSVSPWRVMDVVRQHNALQENFDKIRVVAALGADKDRRVFTEVTGITPLPPVWCPDPASLPEGGEATLKGILGSLLPERKGRRAFSCFRP